MNSLVVFLLLSIKVLPLSFEEYVLEFDRVYASEEEKSMREALYYQKMAYWDQFNSEGHGYTLGPTKFADRTSKEIAGTIESK